MEQVRYTACLAPSGNQTGADAPFRAPPSHLQPSVEEGEFPIAITRFSMLTAFLNIEFCLYSAISFFSPLPEHYVRNRLFAQRALCLQFEIIKDLHLPVRLGVREWGNKPCLPHHATYRESMDILSGSPHFCIGGDLARYPGA